MIIKQDTWHYKLAYQSWTSKFVRQHNMDWFEPYLYPTNLCEYMRQVFKPVWFLLLVLMTAYGMAFDAFHAIMYGDPENWPKLTDYNIVALVVTVICMLLGFLGWLVGAIVGVILALCWIGDWYQERQSADGGSTEPKEPNIIIEWVKAMHSKTCPLITIEEKPEDGK